MSFTFECVIGRCRAGTNKDLSWIEIVYRLNDRAPNGLRHQLIFALEKKMNEHQLTLLSLDLFDEFIRVKVPSSTPPELIEIPMEEVLGQLVPGEKITPSDVAQKHLADFLTVSTHQKG
jgi:hypothetical protein